MGYANARSLHPEAKPRVSEEGAFSCIILTWCSLSSYLPRNEWKWLTEGTIRGKPN